MSTRRRSISQPPPDAREFLDALAAMLADAILRDEAEAAKNRSAPSPKLKRIEAHARANYPR